MLSSSLVVYLYYSAHSSVFIFQFQPQLYIFFNYICIPGVNYWNYDKCIAGLEYKGIAEIMKCATGGSCALHCGAEACEGVKFRCPDGTACDVESANPSSPEQVVFTLTQEPVRANLAGGLDAIEVLLENCYVFCC